VKKISTDFEKVYPGVVAEKEVQKFWKKIGIYKFELNKKKLPIYSIDTPPPTISGSLHVGHIFSFAQAEIFARFKRTQGYNVYLPIGFDNNGLASERLVEREMSVSAVSTDKIEFLKKCKETVKKYEKEFIKLFEAMGFSYNFDYSFTTISDQAKKISQISFIELAKNKLAYTKRSPVLWCTKCQTSIAQAELDSKEIASQFHYVLFKLGDKTLEVATTRPELLWGVVCVLVHPEDKRYEDFINKKVTVPLYDFEVSVISDAKVQKDKGTGAVMCATFGDTADVDWFEQYKLPYKKVILNYGKIAKEVPFIAGLGIKNARKKIVRILKEKKLLVKSENIMHVVSVHERCGREIEIVPSKQWYIDISSKKQKFLEAGIKIQWHPENMRVRYESWVKNLKWDWCISRQRYFGVPFPVWYCKNCNKAYFAKKNVLPIDPVLTPYVGVCDICGNKDFVPEKAVMDTWATSALTPIINLDIIASLEKKENKIKNFDTVKEIEKTTEFAKKFIPMDMRTQAYDIIRTWTFDTIVKSIFHLNKIPWKHIMICGFVMTKKGEKISKSKGNAGFDPRSLIEQHTADALRYWAAGTKLGTDVFFDVRDLKDTKRFLTKLWNSAKFVLFHLDDFDVLEVSRFLEPIDEWIINETNRTMSKVIKLLEAFEIGLARHTIDDFFWKNFCDNYIEIVKQRLYQLDVYGKKRRSSAQKGICYAFLNILKMYSIYVPHLTEYINLKGKLERFTKSQSISSLIWEENLNKELKFNANSIEFGEEFIANLYSIRKFKTQNRLSMNAKLNKIIVEGSKKFEALYIKTEDDLKSCSGAKKIIYKLDPLKN
jgi:valyl-tRNA synthetase